MTQKPSALPHIKVLDLSRVLAGPWCTQMLADLGADVIKVERPGVGDDTRHWGPPFLQDADGNDTTDATYFTACNRNKRSITIDMAHQEGQALIRQMALQSDILVENFKVGGLRQYGLDYESLRRHRIGNSTACGQMRHGFCDSKAVDQCSLSPVTHLRITTVIPQWRPACRGDVRRLRVDPDVIEDAPDSRVPSVMKAIRRICPPHSGHSSGNTS
jgi:hypothetical protein